MANRKFDFAKKIKLLTNAQSRIPDLVGGIMLKHFQKSFREQGFTDENFTAWTARKTKNKSDRRNPKKKRGLLHDSGVMKNSGAIKSANWKRVTVGFYGTTYAEYHNQGTATIPKRKFVGSSKVMLDKVRDEIAFHINKILKQ